MSSKEESIDPRHLLVIVAKILKKLNIPYVVTGGMAVFVWGRPRFTADIDIVVLIESSDIEILARTLESISEYSYINIEAMQNALSRHGEFNFIDGASGIKVDFWIGKSTDFWDKEKFHRRKKKKILNHVINFISSEDLILSKLIWYRESGSSRQLEDTESIIKIQKKLDWKYIQKWAKIQGTINILKELMKKSKSL